MSTPKFIDAPNVVQTSLYGYDRNKKVQVNNLRGRPIVVFRSDEKTTATRNDYQLNKNVSKPCTQSETKSYPSYAHFHHQYSCQKLPPNSSSYSQTAHDRSCEARKSSHNDSPPVSEHVDQQNVKRLFDKLAVTPRSSCTASSSSSSSFSNISSDVTILQLYPSFLCDAARTSKHLASSCCSSGSTSESSSCSLGTSEDSAFVNSSPQSNISSTQMSFVTDIVSDGDCSECGRSINDLDVAKIQNETDNESEVEEVTAKIHTCPDEVQCIVFRGGHCCDERKERKDVLQWYDDLIQWRHDILTKKRFGPPRCPPLPLTVTMIGASRAQRANPFNRVGTVHPFTMEIIDHARNRMEARRPQNLVPSDLPLPAPHEFMINAKCMEPHLFIEYCYQLTAAAYIDTGLNPPHRRPLIPPPIEPIPEHSSRDSIYSSASDMSSDGEYSDDSVDTKKERLRQKLERHARRERRLQQIFRRRALENRLLEEIGEEDY